MSGNPLFAIIRHCKITPRVIAAPNKGAMLPLYAVQGIAAIWAYPKFGICHRLEIYRWCSARAALFSWLLQIINGSNKWPPHAKHIIVANLKLVITVKTVFKLAGAGFSIDPVQLPWAEIRIGYMSFVENTSFFRDLEKCLITLVHLRIEYLFLIFTVAKKNFW